MIQVTVGPLSAKAPALPPGAVALVAAVKRALAERQALLEHGHSSDDAQRLAALKEHLLGLLAQLTELVPPEEPSGQAA